MSGADIGLALSVFLACTVEAVEALTIVLAVGVTRSWSSALSGVGAAIVALAAIVLTLGPAITSLPIDVLRVIVGGILLIFGLQWLGKAILRSAGLKAKHDELQTYEHEAETAREAGERHAGFDAYSFAISFKGVFLEGLEVAFIVLTFGANQHRVGLATAVAGIAVLTVVAAGLAARAPLARVPENTLKLIVGVMLSSFGMFWGAEGAGAQWPWGDAALLAIIPGVLAVALVISTAMRRVAMRQNANPASVEQPETTPAETRPVALAEIRPAGGMDITRIWRLPLAAWELMLGDDWRTTIGVALALAATAIVAGAGVAAWWVMPAAVFGLLALSIRRAASESSWQLQRPVTSIYLWEK
jgi:uncharacterized membrane protein